ncbi:GNAT family acetyltransferase, partial [Klebsiella pneumoniae]|nr:GNAT family acetyltransferase [Klebsiella pneumoniae]
EPVLVAYFTIANKDLYISKRNMEKLSKSLQKKIKQRAQFIEESSVYKLNSFLIGQIGKNYDENALKASEINGFDILNSAFEQAL